MSYKPLNPHDEADERNWPLGSSRLKRFKVRYPHRIEEYYAWLDKYESNQRDTARERFEISNERLKERIDELEETIRSLKKDLWIAGVNLPKGAG